MTGSRAKIGNVFSCVREKEIAMKQLTSFQVIAFLSILMVSLSSCEVVGGIFKAGMWVGIVVVVLVVGLVVWLISKARG